jgi:glutathione S-transferase
MPPLLRIYALTTIVLALKMASIAIVQGRARTGEGAFLNPEDAEMFGGQAVPEEPEMVQRASRAWRNDLENIPIFLILAGIYVSAGLSTTAFVIYCVVFMAARIIHTFCYINSIQPLRTVSFTVGAAVMMAMMIHLFIGVVIA